MNTRRALLASASSMVAGALAGCTELASDVSFRETPTPEPLPDPQTVARESFRESNRRRVEHDRQQLEWSGSVATVSFEYARELRDAGYIVHSLNGGTVAERLRQGGVSHNGAGENLFSQSMINLDGSAEEYGRASANALMYSQEHRANILNERYSEMGVGAAWLRTETAGELFVVQNFII